MPKSGDLEQETKIKGQHKTVFFHRAVYDIIDASKESLFIYDIQEDPMIVSTTNSVENKQIVEYKGLVFGEVISGVNFLKDLTAGIRDILGGRSKTYENEIIEARNSALSEMVMRAEQIGANAIVGVKVDYETLGETNGMLMVICSGTAVRVV